MKNFKVLGKGIILFGIIIIFGTIGRSDLYNYSAFESLGGLLIGAMFIVSGKALILVSNLKVQEKRKRKNILPLRTGYQKGYYEYKKAV